MDEQKPWEQMPGEGLWYGRFKAWLHQKKPRSVLALANHDREQKGRKRSDHAAQNWRSAAEKYRWLERAAAWDKAEQERLDRELAEQREQER